MERFKLAARACYELVQGVRQLHTNKPTVAFFGALRTKPGAEYYELTRQAAEALAKRGYAIITGGGAGIMEAANKGARDGKGHSIGCNISVSREQVPNPFVDRYFVTKYFFVRKIILSKYAHAFVVAPGGIGTMDEFFEVFALMRTGKTPEVPIVLLGSKFWTPIVKLLDEWIAQGLADEWDRELIFVTDSIDELVEKVTQHKHGLSKRRTLQFYAKNETKRAAHPER